MAAALHCLMLLSPPASVSSSFKDTTQIALRAPPTPVWLHLNLTNYIYNNPMSKWGHILRYYGLGLQHIFWGENDSTQNKMELKMFLTFLAWAIGGIQLPSDKMGKAADGAGFGGKDQDFQGIPSHTFIVN